jgi:COMPASS component BRE2
MADPQSQPDLSPRLAIPPRRVDDDHAPTISSPLNPDAAARNKQPKPIVREQREKKESLKKRESAAARSSGAGAQHRDDARGAFEVPTPMRYTIPTPEPAHYNAPKPVVFASHEPNPIFAPDGETELKKSVDQCVESH